MLAPGSTHATIATDECVTVVVVHVISCNVNSTAKALPNHGTSSWSSAEDSAREVMGTEDYLMVYRGGWPSGGGHKRKVTLTQKKG
jgi:hypothetical protein